jgi:hypothetical protein
VKSIHMAFQVLTAASVKMNVFWDTEVGHFLPDYTIRCGAVRCPGFYPVMASNKAVSRRTSTGRLGTAMVTDVTTHIINIIL